MCPNTPPHAAARGRRMSLGVIAFVSFSFFLFSCQKKENLVTGKTGIHSLLVPEIS